MASNWDDTDSPVSASGHKITSADLSDAGLASALSSVNSSNDSGWSSASNSQTGREEQVYDQRTMLVFAILGISSIVLFLGGAAYYLL